MLSLVFHDMQYGPQAALIAETFGTNVRYSGAGLGYQLASVIAGGPAPLIAAAILARPAPAPGSAGTSSAARWSPCRAAAACRKPHASVEQDAEELQRQVAH